MQIASPSAFNTKTALYFAVLSAWSIGETEQMLPWLEHLLPLHYRRPMLAGFPQSARDVSPELRHLRLAAWSDLSKLNQLPKDYTALSLLQAARIDAEIVSQAWIRRSSDKYWWLQAPTAGEMRANTLPKPLALLIDLHQHYLTMAVSQDARATRTYLFHASRAGQYEADFFSGQLQKVDDIILASFRKKANAALSKHQYAKAKAVYRHIIKEYADTGLEELAAADLKKATIAEYFYLAQESEKKNQFVDAKATYRRIIKEFEDSPASKRAQNELNRLLPKAISHYKTQGDQAFDMRHFVPQKTAYEQYKLMLEMAKDANEPLMEGYAHFRIADAGGSMKKYQEGIEHLKQAIEIWNKLPEEQRPSKPDDINEPNKTWGAFRLYYIEEANYYLGFYYGHGLKDRNKGIVLQKEFVRQFPDSKWVQEALWDIVLFHWAQSHKREAADACRILMEQCPQSVRAENARDLLKLVFQGF